VVRSVELLAIDILEVRSKLSGELSAKIDAPALGP